MKQGSYYVCGCPPPKNEWASWKGFQIHQSKNPPCQSLPYKFVEPLAPSDNFKDQNKGGGRVKVSTGTCFAKNCTLKQGM
jgi:hypothetical protein